MVCNRAKKIPTQEEITEASPEAEFMNVTVSLRFLGIILRVLILEVSVYSVYVTNQFQTTFVPG